VSRRTTARPGGPSSTTCKSSLPSTLNIPEQEVQAAINAAANLLPADLPAPPIYAKVNPADAPVLTLALTSKTMPLTQVRDVAETRLAQKISQLAGGGPGGPRGGKPRPGRGPANTAAPVPTCLQHRALRP